MTLRRRLGMLGGVDAEELPHRDPHMVAPALCALCKLTGEDFEVSVAPVEGSTQWGKGQDVGAHVAAVATRGDASGSGSRSSIATEERRANALQLSQAATGIVSR